MPTVRDLLLPLSAVYGGAAALHRRAYSDGLLPRRRVGVPLISVGGLTVGGVGKTPVCGYLARRLLGRGLRVGVVCGAYGGRLRRRVTALSPAARHDPRAARDHGDEALMLAGWLPGADVICGADKAAAAALAARRGAQVVLLDDGFQHHRLHRDLEILICSAGEDLRPLPAGRARELPSAASRADLRWYHGRDGATPPPRPGRVCSRLAAQGLEDPGGARLGPASGLRGQRVHLLAGIARPQAFAALVRRTGARVVGSTFVRDHGRLRPAQLRRAARQRPDMLLCTEKDAARMAGQVAGLTVLTCALELTSGRGLLERALRGLARC
jgi:tetraacyldisaccharide 4'-kinase